MHNGLIKALFKPNTWKDCKHVIKKQLFQGDEDAWLIVSTLKRFYSDSPDATPSIESIRDYIVTSVLAGEKESKRNEISQRLDEIAASSDDGASGSFIAKQLITQAVVIELGASLSEQASNPDIEEVINSLDQAKARLVKHADRRAELLLPTLDEFCSTMELVSKWQFSLEGLNIRTQGFGPGRSALIFGLANVGKSSLTLELIRGFLKQGAKVLDISINEDPFSRRMPRLLQAMSKTPKHYVDVVENKRSMYEKFTTKYSKQYRFVYDPAASITKIRRWVEEFKPDIVIVDNFSKVQRNDKHDVNHAKSLGLILSDLKGLAEEYGFGVIPVCQAAASANGKTRLTMADIADSKVDVPGELEIAIGIAKGDVGEIRYINLVKNKLGKEESFAVNFDEATCKFSEE